MKKSTLVIGASTNPERYSYKAIKKLRQYQHKVYALGQKAGIVEDVVFDTQMPPFEDIHTVTLYINPKLQIQYQDYILNLKPIRVIFNPGTENESFKKILLQNNIQAMEACTLVLLQTNQY